MPQGGSLGQVYHLMAMAKLVLLKRHLVGDVFPQTGCGEYFMWSSRWPRGYDHCRVSCVVLCVVCAPHSYERTITRASVSQGRHGRSSPSQVADALMSRLSREARARYEGVWQRLGERAIALDGDPFDEGKNPHYDAYPVELSMNLDDVHRYVQVYPFFSFSFWSTSAPNLGAHPFLPPTSVQCARHPRVPRAPAHGARLGDGRSDHHALRRQYSLPSLLPPLRTAAPGIHQRRSCVVMTAILHFASRTNQRHPASCNHHPPCRLVPVLQDGCRRARRPG